jgi:hypothetical protein
LRNEPENLGFDHRRAPQDIDQDCLKRKVVFEEQGTDKELNLVDRIGEEVVEQSKAWR